MDAIFLKLFNMSMAAGWLILIILVLRLILKRAPHWIHCLLWGIVAVRLICPVSLQSALSLIPSAETISVDTVRYDQKPVIESGIPAVNEVINPAFETAFTSDISDSVNPLAVWMNLAGIVWAIGVILLFTFALVSYVRLHGQVREAACLFGNVWECDAVHMPFIFGVLRPRIYLPSGLDDGAAGYVLAHERAHLARRDHWWKLIGYVLLAVYWFHPLVWVAYVFFCRDVELACDEKVICSYDMDEKKAYSNALLSVSTHRSRVMVCPLAFGEVGVKERVKSVLNYKKPAFWVLAAAVVLCVIVAVCFLTDPKDEKLGDEGQIEISVQQEDEEAGEAAEEHIEETLRGRLERETIEETLRERLERATDEPIREFFRKDLNRDGIKEAVAITSESADELGYMYANMWYVSDTKCERFYDGSADDASVYSDSIRLYETEGTWLFCCVKGWGGSGSYSQAWMFDADGAKEVENTMEGLTQLSQNIFMVTSSGYDGTADGTGHTRNQYFSCWDGEKLVEYGGLEISEEQLKKAEGAFEILEAVRIYGDIQSIYYRENGMVFINLSDGSLNRNVALTLQNGVLSYFDYGEGDGTALERATGEGIIEKSVTSCVAYPKEFPLDEVKEHVMLTYMLDEPQELPATLYKGDGFSIYLPDAEGVLIYDKTLEEPWRLSVVWGHSIFIEVACYEGKTVSDVEAELERQGYAYDAIYDTGGKKMQKEEDYRLYSEARLQDSGSDVWVVCITFASAYDLGSRLNAIADTFRITEK